jgi:hypothetical protein
VQGAAESSEWLWELSAWKNVQKEAAGIVGQWLILIRRLLPRVSRSTSFSKGWSVDPLPYPILPEKSIFTLSTQGKGGVSIYVQSVLSMNSTGHFGQTDF